MDTVQQLYPKTLTTMKGSFTRGELEAILLVCTSKVLDPRFAGQALKHACSGAVREHRPDVYELDTSSFLSKIHKLHPFELFVLEVWGKSYWMLGLDQYPERAATHFRLLR